ncbi:MAG: hypothetical protein RSD04_01010 [Clostridia bacterium]
MDNISIQQPPKFKNNVSSYILKVIMFAAFYFACAMSAKNAFNLLPYTQYGQKILQMMPSANSAMMLYIAPLFTALIMFGLFHLIEKYCFVNMTRTMSLFGAQLDSHFFYNVTAIAFVAYAIVKGCEILFFIFFPLSANIAEPIVSVLLSFVTMAAIFLFVAKKVGKTYAPFAFSSLMLPTVLLLIVA